MKLKHLIKNIMISLRNIYYKKIIKTPQIYLAKNFSFMAFKNIKNKKTINDSSLLEPYSKIKFSKRDLVEDIKKLIIRLKF